MDGRAAMNWRRASKVRVARWMFASAVWGRPVENAGRNPPGTPSPERRRVSLEEICHIQRQPGLPALEPAKFHRALTGAIECS